MQASTLPHIQPVTKGMQRLLFAASFLVLSVGISLYLLTNLTDTYFAWTITPPLTAAFLGAGYWASFLLELLSARERVWARARLAVPAVLVFTTLTLILTLLHLGHFHFNRPVFITRAGTWVWLAVYASVPVIMTILLVAQLRQPGRDPARQTPLPVWVRLVLSFQALIMVTLGTALFLVPLDVASIWPWTLTALTGRAVGAWLLGIGIAAAQSAWENDWTRLQPVMISFTVYGGLQLIAIARYPGTVNWNGASAWIYLLLVLSILAVGAYGWRSARQALQRAKAF